jgi:hypothetical protein
MISPELSCGCVDPAVSWLGDNVDLLFSGKSEDIAAAFWSNRASKAVGDIGNKGLAPTQRRRGVDGVDVRNASILRGVCGTVAWMFHSESTQRYKTYKNDEPFASYQTKHVCL